MTCDGWQASNVDSYFAVTAHWIEVPTTREWMSHGALIGFVRMNSSHSGIRLGQALFKIALRISIIQKVCSNTLSST